MFSVEAEFGDVNLRKFEDKKLKKKNYENEFVSFGKSSNISIYRNGYYESDSILKKENYMSVIQKRQAENSFEGRTIAHHN